MANITFPINVNLPDDWVEQIVNRLRNDPESEWTEIVRGKDCKHSQGEGYPDCNRVTWWNGENDYCSRAERKEG